MRQYQIHKSGTDYAISDFEKSKIIFATNKNFGLKWKKKEILNTETATKPAFIKYIKPLVTSDGVHPIFNSKGEACEQIVNMPIDTILSSDEILEYLNKYTILPQETPPWTEIIYKLECYSDILTGEYHDINEIIFTMGEFRTEEDVDPCYFVTAPKVFEKKKGVIFALPKPNKAHRKWVILNEHYDFKKNAWINPDSGKTIKRKGDRIELVTNEKPINKATVLSAVDAFLKKGGKIKNLDEKKEKSTFDWKKLEIHPLAFLIPEASKEDKVVLEESIKINGVFEAIWLYEGKILDGRHRYRFATKHEKKPDFKPFKGPGSAKSFVLAMGCNRRHLSKSQRAAIAVDQFLEEYEKKAEKRQLLGVTQKIEEGVKGEACELLSDKMQVNRQYVYDCKKIKEKSPENFQKIVSGEVTISKAKSQLFPRKKRKSYKFEKEYKRL
ncbi:hypothetical protein KAR91_00915, partial [Candidatus Pacearchaeota archaeon]|nr:hypothetical protein [Candidatus Pacearchaeota archaeon]